MKSNANGSGNSASGPGISLYWKRQAGAEYAEWKATAETSIWTVMP
jgi:hypothetical protein